MKARTETGGKDPRIFSLPVDRHDCAIPIPSIFRMEKESPVSEVSTLQWDRELDCICRNQPRSIVIFTDWASGLPRGGGVQTPPPPKFRSFDEAEPNSQFRGKYTRNNLTRIRLSLIFWVVALPTSYDPHSGIFFLSKAWRDVSIRYQKLRKFYHMKWNFLYQITAASRTPD